MERGQFNDIFASILLPYLNFAKEQIKTNINLSEGLKDAVFEKYESMRIHIKKDYMKNSENRINRHKIAALFYVAFVDAAKEAGFRDFKNDTLNDDDKIYLFVHNAAFNAAIGIIENFIYALADEKEHPPGYYSYVKTHGIIKHIEEYADNIAKEIVIAHKNDELFPLLLSSIFRLIEQKSETIFKTSSDENKG